LRKKNLRYKSSKEVRNILEELRPTIDEVAGKRTELIGVKTLQI
jgi:hypothetical protein